MNSSEKKSRIYRVPLWLKAGFFWFAFSLCVALLMLQVYRRYTIKSLMVDNARQREEGVAPEKAPNFSLPKGISGKQFSLSELKGQWVLVNFWATWCPPCRVEMPSLEALSKHFDKKMAVLAVSVDQNWSDVEKFFADRNPPFVLLHDSSQAVAQAYRAFKFPETFVIDPNGIIVAQFSGPHDWYSKEMIGYFNNLLSPK